MNKKCPAIIVLLLLIIFVGAYKFLVQSNATTGTDERTTIYLNSSERDFVLLEMRAFLSSVQQITNGIVADDMTLVAESARKVGIAAQGNAAPETLISKLPQSFKKLGFDTHKKFDLLALDAESLGDKDHALSQLSTLMQNCVACHEAHRFELE